MELTYLKGKDNVIMDALSNVSPLVPGAVEKDNFDAIPVHHITSDILAVESQLERVRVETQGDPELSQLKQ